MFGAYNDARLRELTLSTDGTSVSNETVLLTAQSGILDVEMGRDGFLWVTTATAIYRLVATPMVASGVALIAFAGSTVIAVPALWTSKIQESPGPRRSIVRGPSQKP